MHHREGLATREWDVSTLRASVRTASLAALLLLLSACGGGGGDGDPSAAISEVDPNGETPILVPDDDMEDDQVGEFPPVYQTPAGVTACSIEDINLRVDFDMRDYYIYYDQVPQLPLSDYDEPEVLIKDLRVDPDIYSFINDAEEASDLVDNGSSGGFGFIFRRSADGVVRTKEVFLGSPADDQGVLRGDELLAVNGIQLDEITNEQLDFAFAPDNAPVSVTLRTGTDAPRDVAVEHADFRWRTAGPATRFEGEGLPTVGYLPIRRFLETTEDEIDQSISFLTSGAGMDELIVDLRYNPGGRTHVARHIASLVGGMAVENQVFLLRTWNDKYSANDEADYFDTVDEPLNLPRVYVLVTGSSSSASEVFINALEPYIDVTVIGGVTSGKPFTSNTREYCGKAIHAMRSLRTNALGVSVAGGIQPDCPIDDGWETPANAIADPLTGGALSLIARNTCPSDVMASTSDRPATVRSFGQRDLIYRDPEIAVSEE